MTASQGVYLRGPKGLYAFNPFPPNRPIGEGGMGKVYAGTRSDGTPVAIKILFGQLAADKQFVERFETEGLIQTRLRHSHIISSYDFVVANGKYHIISQLINGVGIAEYLATERQRATDQRATSRMIGIDLFCQVLDALHYLHSQTPAIIHRDIKPDNIMVENGKAIVMDLGVAKVTGGKRQTSVGIVIGTPQYSPPEQIRGESNHINATTDIYAAGITFYELITGNPPFNGSNEYSIMEMQVKYNIPASNAIPPRIYNVLKKATAKKQSDRYQSAIEFKEALLQAKDHGAGWWNKLKAIFS
nr:serine/threonine-protein kinase [uncultured Dyadobacter sp.]